MKWNSATQNRRFAFAGQDYEVGTDRVSTHEARVRTPSYAETFSLDLAAG